MWIVFLGVITVFEQLVTWMLKREDWQWLVSAWSDVFSAILLLGSQSTKSRSNALSGREYWIFRDLEVLPTVERVDVDALSWPPSALSQQGLARMDRCLRELPPDDRLSCVCAWAGQALGLRIDWMQYGTVIRVPPFSLATLAKIDIPFSNLFRGTLLNVMPETFVLRKPGQKEFYDASALVMLRHIAELKPVDPDWTTAYAKRLLNIRNTQPSDVLKDLHTAYHSMSIRAEHYCQVRLQC